MTASWRLILTENCCGAWNMALDEALLKSAAEKRNPPTLRLFGWNPASLSLGFAQPHSDVDQDMLSLFGWDLVRRPTGGRAILHVDELTYSLTAPLDEPLLAGNLLESYRIISQALLTSLSLLGVDARGDKEYQNGSNGSMNPVCFETPSNYEITVNGKKIIGSAQARKYSGLLQHGSLPLFGDLTRITRVLHYDGEENRHSAVEKLLDHATTLENILGKVISPQTAAEAFIEGFSKTFNVSFITSNPSQFELDFANELLIEKYGNSKWTERI